LFLLAHQPIHGQSSFRSTRRSTRRSTNAHSLFLFEQPIYPPIYPRTVVVPVGTPAYPRTNVLPIYPPIYSRTIVIPVCTTDLTPDLSTPKRSSWVHTHSIHAQLVVLGAQPILPPIYASHYHTHIYLYYTITTSTLLIPQSVDVALSHSVTSGGTTHFRDLVSPDTTIPNHVRPYSTTLQHHYTSATDDDSFHQTTPALHIGASLTIYTTLLSVLSIIPTNFSQHYQPSLPFVFVTSIPRITPHNHPFHPPCSALSNFLDLLPSPIPTYFPSTLLQLNHYPHLS